MENERCAISNRHGENDDPATEATKPTDPPPKLVCPPLHSPPPPHRQLCERVQQAKIGVARLAEGAQGGHGVRLCLAGTRRVPRQRAQDGLEASPAEEEFRCHFDRAFAILSGCACSGGKNRGQLQFRAAHPVVSVVPCGEVMLPAEVPFDKSGKVPGVLSVGTTRPNDWFKWLGPTRLSRVDDSSFLALLSKGLENLSQHFLSSPRKDQTNLSSFDQPKLVFHALVFFRFFRHAWTRNPLTILFLHLGCANPRTIMYFTFRLCPTSRGNSADNVSVGLFLPVAHLYRRLAEQACVMTLNGVGHSFADVRP